MFRKTITIFVILLLTTRVSGGKILYESNERIDSTENGAKLILPLLHFNFEINTGSTYQINFVNLPSSESSIFVKYIDFSSTLISSNFNPNNESYYLLSPGQILELTLEKQRCELDVVVTRSGSIILSNISASALVDINAELIEDTGECVASDGFLPYPFISMIFTIGIITMIIRKNKTNKFG